MHAREVLETCLYATDLDAAERFYREVLGLEPFARVEGRHVFFRCGGRVFLVFNPERTLEPAAGAGIPTHGARGPGHVCFAARDDEIPAWRAHLERHGVEVESDFTWPGGGRSLYFRDPAGNSLEVGTPAIWGIPESTLSPRPGPR
ncbi:MAG TPA: VOC family protein [Longimicrobiaceae bacterium]|nr:VOC family protein [Longimicrobiaceae bacterium]